VHNSGRRAKYTAGRRPVRWREFVLKQLTRAQKEALIVSARRRRN